MMRHDVEVIHLVSDCWFKYVSVGWSTWHMMSCMSKDNQPTSPRSVGRL